MMTSPFITFYKTFYEMPTTGALFKIVVKKIKAQIIANHLSRNIYPIRQCFIISDLDKEILEFHHPYQIKVRGKQSEKI